MTRTSISRAVLISAATFAMLACSATAFAQPEIDTNAEARSVTVDLSTINLASASGASFVLQRIDNAANTVCGGEPEHRLLKERSDFAACKREAVRTAMAQIQRNPAVVLARADMTVRTLAH